MKQYEVPAWFRDAKFDIWSHWGPQCVPEQGDWYSRETYVEGKEGGKPGINDKGLVSQDRLVKKDAFHFYKANWNESPMVYLASRRLKQRTHALTHSRTHALTHSRTHALTHATTEVKIYSNADSVELSLNGKSFGTVKPDAIKVCAWPSVNLSSGKNHVKTVARFAGNADVTDECDWVLTQKANNIPPIR